MLDKLDRVQEMALRYILYVNYELGREVDIDELYIRGLPLITYASWGVGGSTPMHTNEYKGREGSDHNQNTHFVRRFIENATISEPFKPPPMI